VSAFLAEIVGWLNVVANAIARFVLAPLGFLPGWLSNTLVACVTGLGLLVLFKHTSHQKAIGRVRDGIQADLLTLKLYKDSFSVTLRAQAGVFKGALLLLVHAIPPLLVMIVPVCLLLAQLGLWYQHRPLRPGEETVVTMTLNGDVDAPWPDVALASPPAAEVAAGPVRALSKRELCWRLTAARPGDEPLLFRVGDEDIEKEFVVGAGVARISIERPGQKWADILLHPAERPFARDAAVRSIEIEYPERRSWTSGADSWVVFFFVVSLAFSFLLRPVLRVRI